MPQLQVDPDANLSLPQAASLPELSVNGRRRHATTLYRWATRGRRGVVLRTRVIGGVRVTTRRWVEQFVRRVTRAGARATDSQAPDRSHDVDDELDGEGL